MQFDTIIIGGGLGGLTASIQLAQKKLKVLLIEKNTYPFHKVCGEYMSNEVRPFIESLGIDLDALGATQINKFQLTALNGKYVNSTLKLGGFGISRFTIDNELFQIAKKIGVTVLQNTSVEDVQKINETFFVDTNNNQTFQAKILIGSYGKRGKLDKSFRRNFHKQENAFVGVKYHIKYDFPKDLIALHNFNGGYCGISAIEDEKFCLCYLANREALRKQGGIDELQDNIMSKNPFLKDIFSNAAFLYEKPIVINEVSFVKKNSVHKNVLMVGDTAGLIAPLAGNGMSIAIRAGVICAEFIGDFFENKISRAEMEVNYAKAWNINFKNRLWRGRQLQKLFGNETKSNLIVSLLKTMPILLKPIIKGTHGKVLR